MAVAVHVYIKQKGAADSDPIAVEHVFYGETEEEADKIRLAHLAGCENFAEAEADDRVAEEVETVSDHELLAWDDVAEEEIEIDAGEAEEEEEET